MELWFRSHIAKYEFFHFHLLKARIFRLVRFVLNLEIDGQILFSFCQDIDLLRLLNSLMLGLLVHMTLESFLIKLVVFFNRYIKFPSYSLSSSASSKIEPFSKPFHLVQNMRELYTMCWSAMHFYLHLFWFHMNRHQLVLFLSVLFDSFFT